MGKQGKKQSDSIFITGVDEIMIEIEGNPKRVDCYFIDDPHHPSCSPHHHKDDQCNYAHHHDTEKKKHYIHIKWKCSGVRQIFWEVEFFI